MNLHPSKTISFFSVACLLLMSGCLSIRPGAVKSGKKYYETFFVGADGTQYFIKKIKLVHESSDESLLMDFTFRYKEEFKDSAVINISMKGRDLHKTIDSIRFSNKLTSFLSGKSTLLFSEKKQIDFVSRFTTKIYSKQLKQLFEQHNWNVDVFIKEKQKKYHPDKKAKKIIKKLNEKIFILM